MERDQYSQKSGDMHRDLEEKEGSGKTFGPGFGSKNESDPEDKGHEFEGKMGDSRPDQSGPGDAHFVDGTEGDPNMQVARRTSELTEPQRELAEEMDAIRHDDTTIVARPQGPFMEEGAELQPLNQKEHDEGDDS